MTEEKSAKQGERSVPNGNTGVTLSTKNLAEAPALTTRNQNIAIVNSPTATTSVVTQNKDKRVKKNKSNSADSLPEVLVVPSHQAAFMNATSSNSFSANKAAKLNRYFKVNKNTVAKLKAINVTMKRGKEKEKENGNLIFPPKPPGALNI